jgi:hypothetical protein
MNYQTPWSRALLNKSPVSQLLRISHYLWSPKIYSFIHKNLPLVPILSQINPVHTTSAYLSKICFNILSPLLRLALPNGLFPSSFPTKSYMHSSFHHACYIPRQFPNYKTLDEK